MQRNGNAAKEPGDPPAGDGRGDRAPFEAQERGLAAAADLLAPGGYLLYSTCSLETEENERVVERVLASRSDLAPSPIAFEGPPSVEVTGSRFRVLPGFSSDGFTAHLIRRAGP